MDPLKFITGTPPAPVSGLSGASQAIRDRAGLLDWHTIDPQYSQAIGQRITSVAPRFGTRSLVNLPSTAPGSPPPNTGPLMQITAGWPGAEFDLNALTNLGTTATPLATTNMSAAILCYSDGAGDQQLRNLAGFYNTGNAVPIRHQFNLWSVGTTISVDGNMTGGAGFIFVIFDSYVSGGVNMINLRARDRAVTRQAAAPVAYDMVARIGNAACRLSLGQERSVTGTSNWDDAIMESWTFTGPTLNNPARLAALDAYVNAVYFNA